MKKILTMALAAALAGPAAATTLTVDGFGAGATEFATLNEALAAIAADSNDGTPDVINITADLAAAQGAYINYSSATITIGSTSFGALSDPLTIDGGGNVLALPQISKAQFYDGAMVVEPGKDNVEFTLQNITIIPASGQASTANGITINDTGATDLDGITLNFDNVTMVANDGSGNPVPATQAAGAGTLGWCDNGAGAYGSGDAALAQFSLSGATFTNYVVNITNSTFAHSRFGGVINYGDGMEFNMTDSTVAYNELGFQTSGANSSTHAFRGVQALNNNDVGMRIQGSTTATVSEITDCVFAGNGANGLDVTDADAIIGDITGCAFIDNGYFGVDLYALDAAASGVLTISDSLFAGNGASATGENDGNSSANLRVEFISALAGTDVVLDGCTFFDYAVDGAATADAHVAITWDGAGELIIAATDCIFAGDSAEVVGILSEDGENAPAGAAINLSNSAVVTAGTYAIAGLGEAVASAGVINDDPDFESVLTTLPLGTNVFDVNAEAFAIAGPGGGPLSGYGQYVGSAPTSASQWMKY